MPPLIAGAHARLLRGLTWWQAQRHHVAAAIMLLATWLVFYAWDLVPIEIQAEAWNIGGSLGRLVLLMLVVLAYRSAPVVAAALWWCFEDAQVVFCGLLWSIAPWPVDTGSRCSDRFGLPLGMIGASLGAVAAWVLMRHITPRSRP